MSYCRHCGAEIAYRRTANERWMPCDAATGEPHFCRKDRDAKPTGIVPCSVCGRPTFIQRDGRRRTAYDYTTLLPHKCAKADVARHAKYRQRRLKEEMAARARRNGL